MLEVLEPTQDPGWGLSHESYNVLSESALEGTGLARPAMRMRTRRVMIRRDGPTGFPQLFLLDPDRNIIEINGAP